MWLIFTKYAAISMPSAVSDVSAEPPLSQVHWQPCWRLVPSRFPPVGLFDRVANSDDIGILAAIEGLTNDRLRDELGDLLLVPEAERQFGAGTTPIMAAFTHINREGSRFSDGHYGVYYAGRSIETALAETRHHRERFLGRTKESAIEVDMRSYACNIDVLLHDIRNDEGAFAGLYNPASYASSQPFAVRLRNDCASNGIVYDSVRDAEGECVAIFRANIPHAPVVQGSHYCFVWDGISIVDTYKKTSVY